jgi:hypothetical protein
MYMDFYAAKQLVDDWCACGWVSETEIRGLTSDEHQAAKMRREAGLEVFPRKELAGLKYSRSKGDKYRVPIEAYDDLELPLVGHSCRLRYAEQVA